MSRRPKRRVVLVGLDGLLPEQVMRYARRVPEMARLLRDGFFAPAIPALPTDTPTNWTTIATGAWSGTHGVVGFGVRERGSGPYQYRPTFNSTLCRAEYLWQAAARQGRRSLLINYPTAFPITLADGVVVGGDGLYSEDWTVRWPELISSWRDARDVRPLALQPPRGWKNLPRGSKALYEGIVDLSAQRKFGWGATGISEEGAAESRRLDRRYLLVLLQDRTPLVLFSNSRNGATAMCRLRRGEWSPWIHERLNGTRCLRRYKLMDLDVRRKRITLYATRAVRARGWAHPPGTERDILTHAGAYVEGLELEQLHALKMGWMHRDDIGRSFDTMRMQAEWLQTAAAHLTGTQDWDVLFAQYHAPDGANHDFLGRLEDEDPRRRRQADRVLEETCRIGFEMAASIREQCSDENTLFCLVSDHGCMPLRWWVNLYAVFYREGWIDFVRDPGTGQWAIDPERSKVWACLNQPGVWVNLKGRDRHGCVEPGTEYEGLRDAVIERLNRLAHPETGEPAMAMVGRREDFEGLGVWGERFADILAVTRPRFIAWGFYSMTDEDIEAYTTGREIMPMAEGPSSTGLRSLSASHCTLPWASVGYASNRGCLLLAGHGIRRNVRAPRVNLVDVAPTLAHYLGIEPPAQSEGRVVHEAFGQ